MKLKQLLLCLLALLSCITAHAYDFEVNGIYYNITDANAKTVEVTNETGDSNSQSYSGDITIPSSVSYGGSTYTVTSIAFNNCSGLTSVTIPNSVTSIGDGAFYNCTGLTSVTIPNSVTSIGTSAFYKCSGLTSVTIPSSVTSIGSSAFRVCSSLTSISVESGNTVYDSRDNCNAIIKTSTNELLIGCNNTTIPNSVTSIGGYAFDECTGLTSVTIPSSVTSIGTSAFYKCTGLTSISVESGNTVYDSRDNCNAIIKTSTNELFIGCKNTTIPNSVTSIGGFAFEFCTGLTSITIPNSVTSIENYAFQGCYGLTSMTIPSSVTSIGGFAFFICTGLTSITIPNSVTSIGSYAFDGCYGLTSITIPNSVTIIGNHAFYSCTRLTSVVVENPNPVSISENVFTNRSNATLYVPAGSKSAYQAANYWKEFKNIKSIDDTFTASVPCDNGTVDLTFKTTGLNPNVVEVYDSPSELSGELTIPATVQDAEGFSYSVLGISAGAFSERAGLTAVTLPEGLTTIGDHSFEGTGLSAITIPESVTTIGQYAFSSSDLGAIVIPSGVTSIGASAFRDCGNLESAVLGSNVASIGSNAFYNCNELTSVTVLMTSPVAITSNVFSNRANATLNVPIGSKAAYQAANNWKNFKEICEAIPFADTNVKALCIANWDTSGDGELSEAEAEAVTDLGGVFKRNSTITSFNELQYFTGLTSIGQGAFSYCTGLTSVTIPNSVTSIGSSAFYNCSGLASITIPNSMTSIGSNAFEGCSGLTSVHISDLTAWCGIDFKGFRSNPISVAHHLYIDGQEVTNLVIPESVTSIGDYAFSGCSGLTSVTIGNSVTSIGYQAFSGCSGLTSVTIGSSVTSIGESAFSGCSGLTSITIPNGVTSIGRSAFNQCSGLASVTLPDGLLTIGYSAFDDCYALSSINLPSTITNIDGAAFSDCRSLTSITLPEGIPTIGEYFFDRCTGLTSITIPNSVTSIGYSAFAGCTGLTSVTIPSSVTSIGSSAFYNCSGLASITIPNSVTSIGRSAFYNCSGLTSITIPNSVTSIGGYAFEYCSGLGSVVVKSLTPASLGTQVFDGIASTAVIYVPNRSLDTYKTSTNWSGYSSIMQPFYTLTYRANYNGEVLKSASVDAFPGDARPAIPQELQHDFVVLAVDGNAPATVSDDHVIDCRVTWNGPFQFSTSEADATWYNLKIRWDGYMYVNETEPYYTNRNVTPREQAQAEYQWAFGGNPYEVVLYNRSGGFDKSMTPSNGFTDRSAALLRDGEYKWDIGQMYYQLEDETYRPDFNLGVKNDNGTAFLNEYAMKELALWVTSNYWDAGNRITLESAPSPNWISGEDVNGIAGNKVTVPVSLENQDEIAGVQFNLIIPAGMTLKKVSTTSRTSAFGASFAMESEGVYTVLLFSKDTQSITTIDGHEGVILKLELETDESLELGRYTITYSDIALTKANSYMVSTVNNTSRVTISDPQPGDANRDGKVNVADIVAVANYILHNPPAKFCFDAANVSANGDSVINVADIVGIANIIIRSGSENQVKPMAEMERAIEPE